MTEQEPIQKAKRAWNPWWLMPEGTRPICPKCNVACTATNGTHATADGTRIQHRRCLKCGHTVKTTIPAE